MPRQDEEQAWPSRMGFRDILMLINMILFFVLGAAMLIRAPIRGASLSAYLMGCGFLFAGLYRLYLFFKTNRSVLFRTGKPPA